MVLKTGCRMFISRTLSRFKDSNKPVSENSEEGVRLGWYHRLNNAHCICWPSHCMLSFLLSTKSKEYLVLPTWQHTSGVSSLQYFICLQSAGFHSQLCPALQPTSSDEDTLACTRSNKATMLIVFLIDKAQGTQLALPCQPQATLNIHSLLIPEWLHFAAASGTNTSSSLLTDGPETRVHTASFSAGDASHTHTYLPQGGLSHSRVTSTWSPKSQVWNS